MAVLGILSEQQSIFWALGQDNVLMGMYSKGESICEDFEGTLAGSLAIFPLGQRKA